MPASLDVVFIDDDENFVDLVIAQFRGVLVPTVCVRVANDLAEGIQAVKTQEPDAIVLDLGLPGETGLSALEKMLSLFPMVPIVVLTGNDNEEIATGALQAGAQDFIHKDRFNVELLMRSLRYAVLRKQTQTSARRVALLEQRAEFIAMLAHDLKNPLLGMNRVLHAFGAEALGALNTEQKDLIAEMQASNNGLLELIQNMLELYKCDQNQFTQAKRMDFRLDELVSDFVRPWEAPARLQNVSLETDATRSRCVMNGDRGALDRLFGNLMSNALKFTPEGGAVKILAECSAVPGRLRIEVTDSGSGMSEDDVKSLFGRFSRPTSTSNYRYSSGLGLYVCKRIVDSHNGVIHCTSQLGVGTTFTVELPCEIAC